MIVILMMCNVYTANSGSLTSVSRYVNLSWATANMCHNDQVVHTLMLTVVPDPIRVVHSCLQCIHTIAPLLIAT